jgi:hypothetical protein
MYPAMYFEFEQLLAYPGNVLLADGRREPQFDFTTFFDDTWFEGETQKVELLIMC